MRLAEGFGRILILGTLPLIPMREGHAQLSPGPLSKAHEALEGLQNCTRCHDQGQTHIAEKCLSCHMALRNRIADGRGLHANPEFRECQTCHVEHQGRDYELVWWDGGVKAFDHSRTGYRLEGAHGKQDCRSCHQGKNIREDLSREEVSPERTFLGMDTACTSCHSDEHRGQLGNTCRECHTLNAWAPAPGFDHSRTKFVLTGRHVTTTCQKCHATVIDSLHATDSSFLRFATVRHDLCTACHTDVHRGRFAAGCGECHTTASWQLADQSKFDHSITAYPLVGRHAKVTCDACHPPGRPRGHLKFSQCSDCHSDFHRGAFAARDSSGACEECHTVDGFAPARFGLAEHNRTGFVLAGAHLAVGCRSCHGDAHAKPPAKGLQFTFETTRCIDCHRDPHRGTPAQSAEFGCESCHTADAWNAVHFDHARTGFPLSGKHASVTCRSCHAEAANGAKPERGAPVIFPKGLRDCSDCHQDVHGGQFATTVSESPGQVSTACVLCHDSGGWKPSTFNHELQSTYRLEGAHRRVPCAACHKPTEVDGLGLVRYRETPRTCQECHGGTVQPLEGNG